MINFAQSNRTTEREISSKGCRVRRVEWAFRFFGPLGGLEAAWAWGANLAGKRVSRAGPAFWVVIDGSWASKTCKSVLIGSKIASSTLARLLTRPLAGFGWVWLGLARSGWHLTGRGKQVSTR